MRKKCIKVKGRNLCVGDHVIGKGEYKGYAGEVTRIGKSQVTIVKNCSHARIKKSEFKEDFIW